jgi:hypothetical protein
MAQVPPTGGGSHVLVDPSALNGHAPARKFSRACAGAVAAALALVMQWTRKPDSAELSRSESGVSILFGAMMRQDRRVAVIEVGEDALRRVASDEVYARAVGLAGAVSDLRIAGTLLNATVDGVPTSVRLLDGGIEGRCECDVPGGAPCAHAVAAALAWVRGGRDEDAPELLEVLVTQSPQWLATRLAAIASGNAELTALLLAEAVDPEAVGAIAELQDELDEELDELEEDAASQDNYGEWYPAAGNLGEMIEEAGEFRSDAPDDVRELADHVISRIERLLDYENCHGSELTEALESAQGLHLTACRAGDPDVVVLAERLVTGALGSGWGVFTDAIARYADVLGPAGLARCGELLEQQQGQRHGLEELRASLARAEKALAEAGAVMAPEADVEP